MNILILTQPLKSNYGGLLQAYALQTLLKRMGHIATTDRYGAVERKALLGKILRFLYHYFQYYILRNCNYNPYRYLFTSLNMEKKKWELIGSNMDYFVEKYIDTIDYFAGDAVPTNDKLGLFDALVVGSDQVWRAPMNHLPAYFLDFVKNMKIIRIAYAASFGTDNINEYSYKQKQIALECLPLFDAISVREDSGVDICKQNFGIKAAHVLDPTMLLSKEDYLELIEDEDKKSIPDFLLTYVLDRNRIKENIIRKVGDFLDLIPMEIGPEKKFPNRKNDVTGCIYPSVSKWLSAFRDARFVITDSFHGTVFAIIFNKPFVTILNAERGASRFMSLLKLFHLEDRLITTDNDLTEKIFSSIDYASVNKVLEDKQLISIEFLQRWLKK